MDCFNVGIYVWSQRNCENVEGGESQKDSNDKIKNEQIRRHHDKCLALFLLLQTTTNFVRFFFFFVLFVLKMNDRL